MFRIVLALLLLASPVWAQDDAAKARMAAGCGPNQINFDVTTDNKQHPTGQPEATKALVYVFANTLEDQAHLGVPITRVGLDGNWVGANHRKSYFFFPANPGEHRLCTSRPPKNGASAAVSFAAEAGKVYYFTTKSSDHPQPGGSVKLVPVDPAEAQLLIASFAYSTFQPKK
jgi:Protein of unknown function (DUF2846)